MMKMVTVLSSYQAASISSTCSVLSSVSVLVSCGWCGSFVSLSLCLSVLLAGPRMVLAVVVSQSRHNTIMSLLLLLLVLSSLLITGSLAGSHERRLLNDLMTHYQKLERPVLEESQAVSLKFGLTLQQILDVVSKERLGDSFSLSSALTSFRISSQLNCFTLNWVIIWQDEKNQILTTNVWLNLVGHLVFCLVLTFRKRER